MSSPASLPQRLTAAAATGLVALLAASIPGCAEKAVEKPAVDVEEARQDHIRMMQRETGQAPANE